jgi:predicted permease
MQINPNCLAAVLANNPASAKVLLMFSIMAASILSGYLASSRFGLREKYSKNIMSFVLVCFEWIIVLLVTWQMEFKLHFGWLPLVGMLQLIIGILIAVKVFKFSRLDEKGKLTLILAGGLSNQGYTGGLFVVYALYGFQGLGVASLFLTLWLPTVCVLFFPYLRARQLRHEYSFGIANFKYLFDWRMLVIPAVITGVLLNINSVKVPVFVTKFDFIDIFVFLASSLSFFAIGMRIRFSRLKNYSRLYFPLAAVKFLLLPAVALLVFWILGLFGFEVDSLIKNTVMIFSCCPSAVMMVTISNIFDLDSEMASSLWAVTNISFIFIVVPILFLIFR